MAICGLRVHLLDKNDKVLADARQWMEQSADLYLTSILSATPNENENETTAEAGHPTGSRLTMEVAGQWASRVGFGQTADPCVADTAVVLECVSETLGLKRRVLREFSQLFPKNTIIASNSSYFTPSTLAEFVNLPERFAHWHFHVPLHRSSIADVVGHPTTAPWVLERLTELSKVIDHIHCDCGANSPAMSSIGFYNPFLRSAWNWPPRMWPTSKISIGLGKA